MLDLYLKDMQHCADLGMVLFNRAVPKEESMLWSQPQRDRAFCIDRFEFPNKSGVNPQGNVSWLEAKKACEDATKELCSWQRWEYACMGNADIQRWTFGNDPMPKACNWTGGAVQPSGFHTKCYNNIGAYDMNGNLAEWTLDSEQAGQAYLAGGHYQSGAEDKSGADAANCVKRSWITKAADDKTKLPFAGFRCCKKLP